MANQVENLEELKRKIYIYASPFIIFALLLNTILDESVGISVYANIVVLIYLSISLVLVYKRFMFRFLELSNLFLISIYLLHQFNQAVNTILLKQNTNLGDFTMWMPIIVIFFYLTLGRKKGVIYSLGIFIITLGIGLVHLKKFGNLAMDSLIQYYLSNIVYILAFYYSQFAFGIFTELKSIKTNAYIDPLTEIANRRKMYLFLDNHLKTNNELSVILMDIDNFKSVNDHYGHDVGDDVLQEFTKLISQHLSEEEMFGRWGGEEFIIFSPATSSDAMALAERLRRIVDYYSFTKVGHVTASFGVSSYKAGDTKESLFKRADVALYQSKSNGKNKVNQIDAEELGRA
ncbi:GGDEF domain-containing protein [Robertmurraya kyonggiensis]|nr:GGDEF domain-containing protein [Robertmurraya kyonggiensis]